MKTAWLAVAVLAVGSPAQDPVDFALRDFSGAEHRLSEQRGKIVVLEWTNYACPAVAAVHESRLIADTRAAVAGDDLMWWQVDSSWFAKGLAADIGAWRDRLGLSSPYLLDPDGKVARSLGAQASPHLFVLDAEGRVAYSGLLADRAAEERRVNYVVAAVRSLRAGEPVADARTRARGCSLKIGAADQPVDRSRVEEEPEARMHYREARIAVRAGEDERALELLERAFEQRLAWPPAVLADGAFRDLMADGDSRRRVRKLLGSRPARGVLTMVCPDEPGEPFVIAGTIRDESGEPIPGAEAVLYQTDHAGWYSEGSTQDRNARLFGFVKADRAGRYRVRTILPGRYADSTDGVRHVHMGFRAAGFRTHAGHRASLYFDDDPKMVGANRAEIESDGCTLVRRTKNAEGVTLAVYDVTLRR